MRFARALSRLIEEGCELFLEVGPHSDLRYALRENLRSAGRPEEVLSSMRRGEEPRRSLLEALGALYVRGFALPAEKIFPTAAPRPLPASLAPFATSSPTTSEAAGPFLLPLSAHLPEALGELATSFPRHLAERPELRLRDVCYTASVRRDHHHHRLALVASSRDAFAAGLDAYLKGCEWPGLLTGPGEVGRPVRLVFVFSGQGTRWTATGRELVARSPSFRATLERCDALWREFADWSLIAELTAPESRSRLDHTEVAQPVLVALQIALAALWRSWGVTPDAVVGHSVGEIAAAHLAGTLDLPQALRVVYHRARLMKRSYGRGRMAAVALADGDALAEIAGAAQRLAVAAVNSPTSTVLSGDGPALEEVVGRLEQREIPCRFLDVGYAFHSPQMDPLLDELRAALAGLAPQPATLPICSTVTGEPAAADAFDAEYWTRNVRRPVRFAQAVERLIEDGTTHFLEIGPHPALVKPIRECLAAGGREAVTLWSLRRGDGERETLLRSLGALYAGGFEIAWRGLWPAAGRLVPLPPYPWQRQRFWIADEARRRFDGREPVAGEDGDGDGARHPLLGAGCRVPQVPGLHLWQGRLRSRRLPALAYLDDHRVEDTVILPGTAYLEMALAAVAQIAERGPFTIGNVRFHQPLFLPGAATPSLQLTLAPGAEEMPVFHVYSGPEDAAAEGPRILHVSGTVPEDTTPAAAVEPIDRERIAAWARRHGAEEVPGEEHYRFWARRGNHWGQAFRGLRRVWANATEAWALIELPEGLRAQAGEYRFHPALLDACVQAVVTTTPHRRREDGGAFVFGSVDRVRLHRRPPGDAFWCHLRQETSDDGEPRVDLTAYTAGGEPIVELRGLEVTFLEEQGEKTTNPADWLYEMRWQPATAPAGAAEIAADGRWLIFNDRRGTGAALAAALAERGAAAVLVEHGASPAAGEETLFHLAPECEAGMRALLGRLLGPNQPPCRGIVHLWSLDAPPPEALEMAALEEGQILGCGSALHLIKSLAALELTPPPRVWWVTGGAQPIGNGDGTPLAVSQAPLWGLGRTLALEHPELWGGMIDLDPAAGALAAGRLVAAELARDDREDLVAFRGEIRHLPRLGHKPTAGAAQAAPRCRSDGTYLITGGLGGLALRAAHWLADRGARRLALLGRSGLPPRRDWSGADPQSRIGRRIAAVRALEARGVAVHLAAVDVGDGEKLGTWLRGFAAEGWPPIRGVLHAAGVLGLRPLVEEDFDNLLRVLRPKVYGGWLLHTLLRDAPLEFFVLYSSASSLLGSPRLGSYAAANAFLDALAHLRRRRGEPALSINWGAWRDIGMAAEMQEVALDGAGSIAPEEGIELLGRLLGEPSAQIGVLPVHWARWREIYPTYTHAPLLEHLIGGGPTGDDASGGRREAMLAADPEQRLERLTAYLAEQVSRVLGIPVDKVPAQEALNLLGLDSMMAMELIGRIRNDLALNLPMIKFLQGPTITRLAELLHELLDPSEPTASGEQSGPVAEPEPVTTVEDGWEVGAL